MSCRQQGVVHARTPDGSCAILLNQARDSIDSLLRFRLVVIGLPDNRNLFSTNLQPAALTRLGRDRLHDAVAFHELLYGQAHSRLLEQTEERRGSGQRKYAAEPERVLGVRL